MNTVPDLSLVIPLYNEEKRIKRGLKEIIKFLRTQHFSWELVVVDDGSQDQTADLAKKVLKGMNSARVIENKHLGKGGAIKTGVLRSHGSWILFLDIDLATPIEEIQKFLPSCKDSDFIIGSRKMQGSNVVVHQPRFREFSGKVFTFLTNLLVTRNISDITCGFKMIKADKAKSLFRQSQLTDWSFDAEILFLAQKNGLRIKELPVVWRDDPQTRVKMLRDASQALLGLLKIRVNDLSGKYKP